MATDTTTITPAPGTWRTCMATVLFAVACGACDSGGSGPSSPTGSSFFDFAPPADPAPGPGTMATSRAELAITSFDARSLGRSPGSQNSIAYLAAVTLRETKETSAVTIDGLYFVLPSGYFDTATPANCSGGRWHVPAGGTWTSDSIYYCMDFYGPVDLPGQEVRVTVLYRDENGSVGKVSGTTTVAPIAGARGLR